MGKFVPASEMSLSDQMLIRREKLAQLQADGFNPFAETKYDVDTFSKDIRDKFEEMEGKSVSLAGRIMSKRGMGKVMFCDLQDIRGRIQLYVHFLRLRQHRHRGGTGVDAAAGFRLRHPLDPVDAALEFQP